MLVIESEAQVIWDTVTVEMVEALKQNGIEWSQTSEGLEVLTSGHCVTEAQADGSFEVFRIYDVSNAAEST